MRGATIVWALLSACQRFDLSKSPPTSRAVVTPAARYRLRSYGIGCGTPGWRSSCQCMCALTMPGITYLPVASITVSDPERAIAPDRSDAGPMYEITPSSETMSTGPYGGLALP